MKEGDRVMCIKRGTIIKSIENEKIHFIQWDDSHPTWEYEEHIEVTLEKGEQVNNKRGEYPA